MIAALMFVAALTADPSGAPAETAPVSAPARPSPIAETDLREFAAIAGRKVVGRPVGGPYATADKVLLIARDDKGYPVIAASIGFPVRQSLPAPPARTFAVIRLHQRSETIVPGPTPDDLAFVAANRLPLFVIGEWARPAPMWEVAWVDDAVRYRTIGEVGEIGPWQD
ncbi:MULTISPECIES: hypothetical protein [unclassified Sphingopyxis]|uniref:hypothetical protein n=1 Tax=unclassified Sphingopyxis TaxID=2614943 RepID=UPI000785D069|nr:MULTISPECIES: hypothetical protein [unclassified Sphingopyxis]USI77942.1 hypothetical protein KEC45_03290 [Sphingopyxis sp. USTB-05]